MPGRKRLGTFRKETFEDGLFFLGSFHSAFPEGQELLGHKCEKGVLAHSSGRSIDMPELNPQASLGNTEEDKKEREKHTSPQWLHSLKITAWPRLLTPPK